MHNDKLHIFLNYILVLYRISEYASENYLAPPPHKHTERVTYLATGLVFFLAVNICKVLKPMGIGNS